MMMSLPMAEFFRYREDGRVLAGAPHPTRRPVAPELTGGGKRSSTRPPEECSQSAGLDDMATGGASRLHRVAKHIPEWHSERHHRVLAHCEDGDATV